MKKANNINLLVATAFWAMFVVIGLAPATATATSVICGTHTFSNADIYYGSANPGRASCQCPSPFSTCDGGSWYPDNASAQKLCEALGYNKLVSFTTQNNFYTSPYNNYEKKWNGSSFTNLCAMSSGNKGIDTVTCSKTCDVACSSNADCGTSSFVGDNFCQDGNVYKNYKANTCLNPGTAQSSCSTSTTPVYWYGCAAGQTCVGGQCLSGGNVACSSNADCGTNGFVDGLICTASGVSKNYKSYICQNPGTVQSSCTSSTTTVQGQITFPTPQ